MTDQNPEHHSETEPATERSDGPHPGEMHEVDEAFHRLTVAQRDAAWREIERLRKALARAWLMVRHDASDAPGCVSMAIRPYLESVMATERIDAKEATDGR